jgi:hypothetical protein
MVNLKELAKFFSGITAWESIAHLFFLLSSSPPITIIGITLTPTINIIQVIVPAIVSVILAYYAWLRK